MYTRLAFCGWKGDRSARWLSRAMKTMIELIVRVSGMCEVMPGEEVWGVDGTYCSSFEVLWKFD